MKKKHALVLGATGATGKELVKLLLNDSSFEKVSIFVRNIPNIKNKKLKVYKIDFLKLEDYKDLIFGDVLFSALGTTLKDAKSKSQQYLVDYTYQYKFAKMAIENEIKYYSLVSSVGSNKNSLFFYPKMKGTLEEDIIKLGFKKTYIFQPPLLIRHSNLMRPGEKIGIKVINIINRIGLFKSQKPLSVLELAKKMVNETKIKNTLSVNVYKPSDIVSTK